MGELYDEYLKTKQAGVKTIRTLPKREVTSLPIKKTVKDKINTVANKASNKVKEVKQKFESGVKNYDASKIGWDALYGLGRAGAGVGDFIDSAIDTGMMVDTFVKSNIPILKDTKIMKKNVELQKDFIKKDFGGYARKAVNEQFGGRSNYKDPENALGGKITEGIGGLIPQALVGAYSKPLQIATIGANAMGGSSEQALNEGATINQATAYGGLSGGLEVAVENAFGGLGKLMPDGVISNVVRKVTGNGIVSKITDVLGEGAEEYISTSIDPYLKRLTYDEKAELASNEEKLESFLVGSIISSVAQIGGNIGTNRQNNVNSPKLLPQMQQNTPQTLQPQGINSTTNINTPKIDLNEQGNINTSLENGVNAQNDKVQNILPNEIRRLEDRLIGDKLLYTIDFINEIKNVGAKVDENGYVTVYHQTTSENAKKIIESGKMSAKEDGIFFSTSKNAQQSDGRGNAKLEFKIPAEKLILDDLFNDNADVRLPLKNKNEKIDVSKYLVKENIKYSKPTTEWGKYLKENWDLMPNSTKTPPNRTITPLPSRQEIITPPKKVDLVDISKMTQEDAKLPPTPKYKLKDAGTTNERSFYENVGTAESISKDVKNLLEPKTYNQITNEKSMQEAMERLDNGGRQEVDKWLLKDIKNTDSVDVAEGIVLLERYQQQGDFEGAVNIVEKLAEMGTKAGQQVQMFSILRRLTPEGMQIYAQRSLDKAFNELSKNKTNQWIEENKSEYKLTPDDSKFIQDNMNKLQEATTQREKDILLGEIASRIQDKLPPEKGQGIKAYMRISMLFNPKTQIRNVMGNVGIAPVNAVADVFGTLADKIISKITGTRTTNLPQIKAIAKGFYEGGAKTIDDFKRGIRTSNMGNRFEIGQGKSFNEKTKIKAINEVNKRLNTIDNLLSTSLELGDRPFYEASFVNSLEGQMKANNVTIPTNEMIDIATTEALERTWQDNNEYTQFVLGIRNKLNKANIKGYGLGDVLIPFAKTPANLTKAIVDYSPAGVVNTIIDTYKLNTAIKTGNFTPQMQKKVATDIGKTLAGSLLYILGYGLAKAGKITGGADEDKDVANFVRNVLGQNPYSFKIGDKSFTYDWAQPVATPFAIASDLYKMKNKTWYETIYNALSIGGNQIIEQSFMSSIKELFNKDSLVDGILDTILDLPSRAVPTLFKQFADLTDKTARTSFEYNNKKQTLINKMKAKLPQKSKELNPVVNTLGEEVQRLGGENNLFNVFLNPATLNSSTKNNVGNEVLRLYNQTGDKTIFPRVAPYYIMKDGQKVEMTGKQKTEFQKISGQYVKNTLDNLISTTEYKSLNDEGKRKLLNEIVSDSYEKAKNDILSLSDSTYENKSKELETLGNEDYYKQYIQEKGLNVLSKISKSDYDTFYSLSDAQKKEVNNFIDIEIPFEKYSEFAEGVKNISYEKGKSGAKKEAVIKYINSIKNLNRTQKLILLKSYGNYKLSDTDKERIRVYINDNKKLTVQRKKEIWESLGY